MAIEKAEADTFPKLLLHHSRQRGERPALREKKRGIWRTVTWRELADEAAALAAALSARGLQRGGACRLRGRQPAASLCRDVRGALAGRRRGAALSGCDGRRDGVSGSERGNHPRLRREPGAGRQAARDPAAVPDGSLHRLRQGPGHAPLRPARACQLRRALAAGPGTRRRKERLPAGRGRARQPARTRPSCSSPRARPALPKASSSPMAR